MVADIAVSAASSIAPYAVVSSTDAVGRKRRREQKAGSDAGGDHAIVDAAATPKIAKVLSNNVVACSSSSSSIIVTPRALANPQPIVTVRKTDGAKRPQMKYDPSIPMTKEETSAWRREQRRKRNRESAAACRKRQRDRISELEHEVNGWKAKFDEALRKLGSVEGEESARDLMLMLERSMPVAEPKSQADGLSMERCGTPPNVPEVPTSMNSQGLADSSRVVSPYDRPKFIPPLVTSSDAMQGIHFPVLEDPIHQLKASTSSHHNQGSFIAASDSINSRVENRQHLNEKITRPAASRLLKIYHSRRRPWADRFGHHLLTQ